MLVVAGTGLRLQTGILAGLWGRLQPASAGERVQTPLSKLLRQFPGMALAASLAGPGFTPLSKGADSRESASGGILTSQARRFQPANLIFLRACLSKTLP
jgi:hypothetical protein